MKTDLLANVERERGDRQARVVERDPKPEYGFWHGSAVGEVERWRRRALVAELEVQRLRALARAAGVAVGGRVP